jgi:hypothetical protein
MGVAALAAGGRAAFMGVLGRLGLVNYKNSSTKSPLDAD